MTNPVVVLGGGLSGIACALRVAQAGRQVVLVESRRKLGGRATSFTDPRSGETLDNCQHVLMGSCTNLIDLYSRLGVSDSIEWHRRIHWANPPHDPDTMEIGILPAPAHYARSFMRMRFLSTQDKRAIARAMWKMIRMGRGGREAWRGKSFGQFLDSTAQTERARSHFWEAIITSACNDSCDRTDAFHGMLVFQQGFLQDSWSPNMGVARVPLAELYEPARGIIEQSGGAVRLGVSALALNFDGRRVSAVVTDEGVLEASSVVSALPPDRLSKLCSPTLRNADSRLANLDEIPFSPIVGVHLFFEQSVMALPHLVLPGRATHWLFNKGRDSAGRFHVHAVISGAHDWMELQEAEIVRRVLVDLHWALRESVGIEPTGFRSVKEKRATFSCKPGIDAQRPGTMRDGARGGIDNLILAGDWCDTGWPATMEGAVRSGNSAAAAVLGAPCLVDDVPAGAVARLLGL